MKPLSTVKKIIIILMLSSLILIVSNIFKSEQEKEIITFKFIDHSNAIKHYSSSSILDTMTAGGVCVADINNDGWEDIFIPGLGELNNTLVEQEPIGNSLYINLGVNKDKMPDFTEISEISGVKNIKKLGVGCAIADFDNDGLRDILVTNATKSVGHSAYGAYDPSSNLKIYPPSNIFKTDKTDGKYNFPEEGGVTLFKNMGLNNENIPSFTDTTTKAGLVNGGNGTAAVWADFDNDGNLDLFVGNYSDLDFIGFSHEAFGGQYNYLYKNNGNETFTDVSEPSGLKGVPEYVFDFEGNKVYGWNQKEKDSMGRIIGDPAGNTLAAASIYYNDDLLLDLVVADDVPGRIRMYQNMGDFKFKDVSEPNDMGIAGAWMGFGIGDINGDEEEDIFATNFGGPRGSRYRLSTKSKVYMENIFTPPNKGSYYNGLWIKDAKTFKNVARLAKIDWGEWQPNIRWFPPDILSKNKEVSSEKPEGLEYGEFGFGTAIFDHDNDGLNDILWIGSLSRAGLIKKLFLDADTGNPARLLKNIDNDFNFIDISKKAGLKNLSDKEDRTSYQNGRGLAIGDLNNDGYHDIIFTNSGGWDSGGSNIKSLQELGSEYRFIGMVKEYAPGKTFMYISPGGQNNWIKLRLEGTTSNKDAIGSTIRIEYYENDVLKKKTKVIRAGESYASQNSLNIIFGLGEAEIVDKILINWPSGNISELKNTMPNQTIKIKE